MPSNQKDGKNQILEENQEQFLNVVKEITELRYRKMYDYGLSYQTHGSYGISVRLTDKVQRLVRLLMPGAKPNYESIVDTYKDIASYAIMGVMEEKRRENIQ